ncbi:hypothetical protein CLAFUR4_08549 [Fulvia fulva]|nr:hypothetical protein CLAFUR4_08549 [Fulvia fulva]KAK4630406.1 hypothetical protein CLAFUR0_08544 [Fulvia fulva]WPV27371.1 hypothetical protein CLAFUW7_08544 [Fulvia fulva]
MFHKEISENKGAVHQSTEGHKFFVEALRSVLDNLHAARRASANGKADRDSASTALAPADPSIVNKFDALNVKDSDTKACGDTVYDTADEIVVDTNSKHSSEPSNGGTVEIEDDIGANSVALFSFLKKTSCVRRRLRKIWQKYKTGEISFTHAAIVTEAGIVMLRQSASGLILDFPEFNDFGNVADFLRTTATVMPGTSCASSMSIFDECDDDESLEVVASNDYRCASAWLTIKLIMEEMTAKRSGKRKKQQKQQKKSKYICIDAGHPFGRVLSNATPHIRAAAAVWARDQDYGGVDLFTSMYAAFLNDHKSGVSLLLVVTLQIQQDIFDLLGPATLHLETTFHQTVDRITRAYYTLEQWNPDPRTQDDREYRTRLEKHIKKSHGLLLGTDTRVRPDASLSSLFEHFPVLVGCSIRLLSDLSFIGASDPTPGLSMANAFSMAMGVQLGQYSDANITRDAKPWLKVDLLSKDQSAFSAMPQVWHAVHADPSYPSVAATVLPFMATLKSAQVPNLEQYVQKKLDAGQTLSTPELLSALETSLSNDEKALKFSTQSIFREVTFVFDHIRKTLVARLSSLYHDGDDHMSTYKKLVNSILGLKVVAEAIKQIITGREDYACHELDEEASDGIMEPGELRDVEEKFAALEARTTEVRVVLTGSVLTIGEDGESGSKAQGSDDEATENGGTLQDTAAISEPGENQKKRGSKTKKGTKGGK